MFDTDCGARRTSIGFTLIELVMTITILGILSATVLPKFFDLSTFTERAVFDDTLNAMRYAQKLAVATNCNVQVTIASNTFQLKRPGATDRSQCASTTSGDFTADVDQPGSHEGFYSGGDTNISLTTATFYFTAKGTATADQTISVGSNGKQISVIQATGFVYDSSS